MEEGYGDVSDWDFLEIGIEVGIEKVDKKKKKFNKISRKEWVKPKFEEVGDMWIHSWDVAAKASEKVMKRPGSMRGSDLLGNQGMCGFSRWRLRGKKRERGCAWGSRWWT